MCGGVSFADSQSKQKKRKEQKKGQTSNVWWEQRKGTIKGI